MKFKQLQRLLGMCVENTNEMSNTIKVSMDVQDVMKEIQGKMQEEIDREANNNSDEIIKQLTDSLNSVKQNH